MRRDTSRVIINAARPNLTHHLATRFEENIGQNVNLLGEVLYLCRPTGGERIEAEPMVRQASEKTQRKLACVDANQYLCSVKVHTFEKPVKTNQKDDD